MTEITKSYQTKSWISLILSIALNVVPVAVFIIAGISTVDVQYKVVLSFTALISAILGVIMLLSKAKLGRSLFWIVFLVMYFCMGELYPMIITMGVCTIIDELIVTPYHRRVNEDYHTNKQIDKRE